jgi:uncharacterized RDD family membrane protein YckC
MHYIGVGRRFLAILVDSIVGTVWTYPFLDIDRSPGYTHIGLTGFPFVAVVVIWLVYFTVMEALFGATVGKFVTGIRVRRPDGSKIDAGTSVVRNLGRIIDWLPVYYLVGAISVWTSPQRQRLGDRWANTVVIDPSRLGTAAPPPSATHGFGPPGVPAPPGPVAPPPMPPPPPAPSPVVIPESEPTGPATFPDSDPAPPPAAPGDAEPREPDGPADG